MVGRNVCDLVLFGLVVVVSVVAALRPLVAQYVVVVVDLNLTGGFV